MQVVRKIYWLIVLFSCISCFSQNNKASDKSLYKISKHKSESGSTYLNLNAFEYENKSKRSPVVYQINNIIMDTEDMENLILRVMDGNFNINAGAISKKWTVIKDLDIKKGDSLYVKIYLKDDPTPLE